MGDFKSTKELAFLLSILKGEQPTDEQLDPKHLLSLAKDHRIVSRIANQAAQIPNDLRLLINEESKSIKVYQLQLTIELQRIHNLLSEMPFMVLKGPVLSQVIYQNPAERQSKDLDVFVEEAHVDKAIELLTKGGYTEVIQHKTSKQKKAIRRHYHHVELNHPEKGIQIELHWNLTANKNISIQMKDLLKKTIKVKVGNKDFNTLDERDLIGYLCIHGVFHAYFRLQWLIDIYMLLKQKSEEEQEKLYDYFKQEGIEHYFLITLALLEQLLDLSMYRKLQASYSDSKKLQQLTLICLEEINDNDSFILGHPKSGGTKNTLRRHRIQYLSEGLTGLVKSVNSRNVRPQNWQVYAFPDRFFFLNNLFSRFVWLFSKLKKKNR